MHARYLAPALAVTLASCGGGESPDQETSVQTTEPAPALTPLQQEVSSIVTSKAVQDGGYEFPGIDPEEVRSLGTLTVSRTGENHQVEVASVAPATDNDSFKGEFYARVQGQAIEFARRFRKLPLNTFKAKSFERTEPVIATLNISTRPSTLVLTKPADFSTPFSRRPGNTTAAVTFRPTELPKLNRAISFVAPTSDAYLEALAVGVEACQAKIDVRTKPVKFRLAAQEVICNSWALAYVSASTPRFAYEDYTQVADTNRSFTYTSDGLTYLPKVVFSKRTYQQMQANETPTSLKGWRLIEPKGK